MAASDMDETEHGGETAVQDFDQPFAGMGATGFGDGESSVGFPDIMPAGSEAGGMEEPHIEVDNSAMIAGLPVMMKVVLGSAKMPVATLAKLAKGSVVKLDKMVGDPVDILVNGHLIARGQVVILNEASSRFGVVLTQVGKISPGK